MSGLSLSAQGLDLPPVRGQEKSPALPDNLSTSLARLLRPQAAYRWLLPSVAAITPQYIESVLRGALAGNHVQQWELFDLMEDTWPTLASVRAELVEGVLKKKLVIEPYSDEDEQPTPEAIRRMKVVSAALRRMSPDPAADENDFKGTLKDLLSGWFQGTCVLETNWQALSANNLGQIIAPKSTYWVHPVCWAWDMDGRLGLRQELGDMRATSANALNQRGQMPNVQNMSSWQPRPSQIQPFLEHKFLVGIHKDKSGTALGGALLRKLAWWWLASSFSADWVLNLAQVFGLPFRWANYDPAAPQPIVDAICNMLQNMGSNGWAAFPAGTTMEMKETSKGSDNSPQGELLDRADRYVREVILGQTLTGSTGTGKGGGLAFGETEAGVKADRIDAAADYTCQVVNSQLIRSICVLNFGDDSELPTARLLATDEGGLADAQRDQTLAAAGLKIGVNFVRKKYGIPAPEDGEETIGGSAPKPVVTPDEKAPDQEPEPEPMKASNSSFAKCNYCGKSFNYGLQPEVCMGSVKCPHCGNINDQGALAETPMKGKKSALTAADASASSLNEKSMELVLAAQQSEFEALNQQLVTAANIDDPDLQSKKLAKILSDLDRWKKNLHHNPAIADALYKAMSASLANGLAGDTEPTPLRAADAGGFDESQHPRDNDGKFVSIGDEHWSGTRDEMRNRAKKIYATLGSVEHPKHGTVHFTSVGSSKTFNSARTPHDFQAVQAYKELVRTGVESKPSASDRKGRPNVEAFHYLKNRLQIGDKKYKTEITLRTINKGKFTKGEKTLVTHFYLHELKKDQ